MKSYSRTQFSAVDPRLQTVFAALLMSVATVLLVALIEENNLGIVLSARFFMGALWFAFFSLLLTRAMSPPRPSHIGRGLLMLLNTGAFLWAANLISPGVASALAFTFPLYVPFLAWAVHGTAPKTRTVALSVICACGVALIFVEDVRISLIGVLAALSAGVLLAVRIVWDGVLGAQQDKISLTVWSSVFAGLGCAPFAIAGLPALLGPSFALGLAAAALLATAGQLLIINVATQKAWPTLSLLLFLEVPMTTVLGVMFLGDLLGTQVILGMMIIFAVVVLEAKH